MIGAARSRVANFLRAAAPPAILTLVAVTLLRFPPTHFSFYPQCPIYDLFHLQCPGCGATRALAALLRGHIAEALRYNALITLSLPITATYGVILYHRFLEHKSLRLPQLPSTVVYVAFTIATAFAVVRNLTHVF